MVRVKYSAQEEHQGCAMSVVPWKVGTWKPKSPVGEALCWWRWARRRAKVLRTEAEFGSEAGGSSAMSRNSLRKKKTGGRVAYWPKASGVGMKKGEALAMVDMAWYSLETICWAWGPVTVYEGEWDGM